MRKNEYDVPVRICKVLNVILMMLCFAGIWYGYYADRALVDYYRRGDWVVVFLFGILYFGFCRSYDAFHISTSPISELIYSQGLSLVISDFAMYMVIWLLSLHMPCLLYTSIRPFWNFGNTRSAGRCVRLRCADLCFNCFPVLCLSVKRPAQKHRGKRRQKRP